MGLSDIPFEEAFRALTGHAPFAWQGRLYAAHFARGHVPAALVTAKLLPRNRVPTCGQKEIQARRCVSSIEIERAAVSYG